MTKEELTRHGKLGDFGGSSMAGKQMLRVQVMVGEMRSKGLVAIFRHKI